MKPVRKVVFPAAGLGTRFLPATKAMPKEMLPLVDRPIIQYGVEEAVAAGIEDVILVTNPGKQSIEDHLTPALALERFLDERGKHVELELIRQISKLASVRSVNQGDPLGLGHAVLVARDLVGHETFAVVLPDDIYDATPSALAQMVKVFQEVDGPVVAVERVPRESVSGYGVIASEPVRDRVYRITDMVEKPSVEDAPSDLAIVGRYILTPDIFDELEQTQKDSRGEIQLTDAMKSLLAKRPFHAVEIDGVRHDTGNKLGFLKAVAYFGLKRPELAEAFGAYLDELRSRA